VSETTCAQCESHTDISKAFDTVSHTHLLVKLRRVGTDGRVLSWIMNYLSNRRQRCIVDGSVSDWLPVTSGVPQGSILGPLLFLIYIDDIAADLLSKVALFADDCGLFRPIHSREDQYLLQQDLDRRVSWSRKWHMNFSPDKCEVQSIGFVKKPLVTSYFLNEHELKKVDEHKHLGITITSTLNWSAHIERMAAKARKVWGGY